MTAVITNPEGTTHLLALATGTAPPNAFDALELGQGLNTPTIADTRASLTSKIPGSLIQVANGYPIANDQDIRNSGRGANVFTWKFVYPEGALQILCSNLIVTNYQGGAPGASEPVMVSANETFVKRPDQVLTVFVNAANLGGATVVGWIEDGQPLVEQMQTWRQQSIALSGSPGAQPVTNGVVQSRLNEGEQAWTAARLLNSLGGVMTRDDVVSVTLRAMKRDGQREWATAVHIPLNVDEVFTFAPIRNDPRWRGSQGYNFAHAWVSGDNWGSRRTRLEYSLLLSTGDRRTIAHEIEWASMR